MTVAAPPGIRQGRILYGGTFNPPHTRHMEVALTALRLLAAHVDGVEFIPCARPPHKPEHGVLPFALRCDLVEAALKEAGLTATTSGHAAPEGTPLLRCNRMEGERQGPSYTWDTLTAFRAAAPEITPYFLLGGEDYALLPAWRRGLELPVLCRLIVAPRGDVDNADAFRAATRLNWPEAREAPPLLQGTPEAPAALAPRMTLPGGSEALLLPLPPQSTSASEIRTAWLNGRSPAAQLSRGVLQLLEQHREAVTAAWRKER